MIRLAGWEKFWQARAELRDLKAKYQSMVDHYRTALLTLDALRTERDDLAFQLECMSVDNADLERVNEALRGGLQFFDPSSGRSEA